MPELYDDKAVYALYDLLNVGTKEAKEILDAVAPLIVAKALRRVAIEHGSITDMGLMGIADEIEAGR